MMAQHAAAVYLLSISDCESHGHRITLSVLHTTPAAKLSKPYARVANNFARKPRAGRALTYSRFLHDRTCPRLPGNCTKPIKEDTVAFDAA